MRVISLAAVSEETWVVFPALDRSHVYWKQALAWAAVVDVDGQSIEPVVLSGAQPVPASEWLRRNEAIKGPVPSEYSRQILRSFEEAHVFISSLPKDVVHYGDAGHP